MKLALVRSLGRLASGFVVSMFRRQTASVPFPARPTSALALQAEEAAVEQSAALVAHGYRTWLLGAAFADHDRVSVDAELLFVASLLHDSGMMREVLGE